MNSITIQQGSKSFYLATRFLPRKYREDASYLYGICRHIDDIVDTAQVGKDSRAAIQAELREVLTRTDVIAFFSSRQIPIQYLEELVEGVLMDLEHVRFQTFHDLQHYCYLVAGTVGAMMTHLFGVTDKDALLQAQALGSAMQITNILRDVQEDAQMGRVYFALEDLHNFDVTEEEILTATFSNCVRSLVQEYSQRAWHLYKEGNKGISALPFRVRFSIRAAWYVYSGILKEIEKNDFNPFLGRIVVPLPKKITRISTMYATSFIHD